MKKLMLTLLTLAAVSSQAGQTRQVFISNQSPESGSILAEKGDLVRIAQIDLPEDATRAELVYDHALMRLESELPFRQVYPQMHRVLDTEGTVFVFRVTGEGRGELKIRTVDESGTLLDETTQALEILEPR